MKVRSRKSVSSFDWRWIISGLIIMLFIGLPGDLSLFAQKNPKEKFNFSQLNPVKMPDVKRVELDNGLTIYLVEDHEFPTIDIRAMVGTGSIYEPADKIGLASMTGQVLRQGGTLKKTGEELNRELEEMAATIETFIGQSSGTVAVSMLKEDADRVLELLGDILLNPAFREDKVELVKLQQKSYISRRNDQIRAISIREFSKIIFGKDSPYARHPEYATIDAISREDIINYYHKYFSPDNTIMAVWGDFESSDLLEKIKKNLGSWQSRAETIPALPEVKYDYKFTVNLVNKPDVKQTYILMGHIGGIKENPDNPALIVMNSILSNERMFKKIRTDEGLAYTVWGAYGSGYRVPGAFSAGAQTKTESTVYAIELMLQEIKRITEEPVTDEELARAKDMYLNSFVFNFDSKAKIVNRMMTYTYFDYPLDFAEKTKKEVEKVTKSSVLRVAKKYLRPEKLQILVVGNPDKFDKPLSSLGDVNIIDISIPIDNILK